MNALRALGCELGERDRIEFEFEGQKLAGRRGETLAAALTACGIRELRWTWRNEPRGIYCGMGICQECLVEIDGHGMKRACMTKLERPMKLRRQKHPASLPDLRDGGSGKQDAAVLEPDILVLGGGAGGLNAATAAARAGLRVLLVDERPQPGGQYYKQPLEIPAVAGEIAADHQFAGGQALILAAEAAGVTMMRGAEVWGAFEPLELMIFDGQRNLLCRPRRLIAAAGAYERALAVPGWTLPSVMTTGAAQTLLRSYRVLAGRRVLIAGNGPLNLQVALELARAGAEVVAIAELGARPGLWALPALAAMLTSTPALAFSGLRYLVELHRRGIPMLYGSALARVEKSTEGLSAEIRRWPGEGAEGRRIEVDAVCMGYGFLPSNEILRALNCAHCYDPARGQLVVERDADCRTSVAEIYAVGDCAGLGGAPAAEAEGLIAGLAAARSLGVPLGPAQRRSSRRAAGRLARHRRFQAALWRLFQAPRLATELAEPETLICRCEELSLADIAAELEPGAESIGALKRRTRAGMGRCQGRYCGPILAALSAEREGRALTESSHWAPRPPAKPMRIADIMDLEDRSEAG